MNYCKNVFDWGKHINQHKTAADKFSTADWDMFNAYVIHRLISMNPNHLIVANEAQKFHPTEKRKIYEFYKEFIPKNNKWSKYVKSKTKKVNSDLLLELSSYYQCSQKEATEYKSLLAKPDIVRILTHRGNDDKTIKKLLK